MARGSGARNQQEKRKAKQQIEKAVEDYGYVQEGKAARARGHLNPKKRKKKVEAALRRRRQARAQLKGPRKRGLRDKAEARNGN